MQQTSAQRLSAILIMVSLFAVGGASCSSSLKSPSLPHPGSTALQPQDRNYTMTFNREPLPSDLAVGDENPDDSPAALPLEPILEAMGATYTTDQTSNTLRIRQGNYTATLQIDNELATRNGYDIRLVGAPRLVDGQVWLPSQALTQLLELDYVRWNSERQEYQLYRFQVQSDRQTTLERAAIEQVQHYLSLMKQARQRTVSRLEWETVLTEDAVRTLSGENLRGIEPAGFYPTVTDASEGSLRTIEVVSARQLTTSDTLRQGMVKVVVHYTTDYIPNSSLRTHWEARQPEETRHEKIFLVKTEAGELYVDAVISQRSNRSPLGAPLPLLNEVDLMQMAEAWQQRNTHSYSDLTGDFSVNFLSHLLARARLGDETALEHFSVDVKQSQDWQDFLALDDSKDPIFTFLEATSTEERITGTLVGNWITDSVNFTPVLMEVELERQGNFWKLTQLTHLRRYGSSQALWMKEPQTYDKIAAQYAYRMATQTGWMLL